MLRTLLSVFKPSSQRPVTAIIVLLNVLVWLAMICSGANFFLPSPESLLKWGADFRPVTLDGEWWRLITCMFIHVGILHLLLNMYALLYIGLMLEPLLGKVRFIAAYLVTGVIASLSSITFHDNSVGAGASGAIFGMFGVFLALLTTNLIVPQARKPLLKSMLIFVVLNLAVGMINFIDNSAHVGGLISGMATGYIYYFTLRRPWLKIMRIAAVVIPLLLTAGITALAYRYLPKDSVIFQRSLKRFDAFEQQGMAAIRQFRSADDMDRDSLKTAAIASWQAYARIADSMQKLKLSKDLEDQIALMRQYAALRIEVNGLIIKSVEENTDKYNEMVISCNKKIKVIVKQLDDSK